MAKAPPFAAKKAAPMKSGAKKAPPAVPKGNPFAKKGK
jgi:hypothetical protein